MKFLLDQNLSPGLVGDLIALYPGSAHVRQFGLERASDGLVWDHARASGFTLLSKDSDFIQLSFLLGAPPKVVHLRAGNCSTREVLHMVLAHRARLMEFEADAQAALLVLGRGEQNLM